MSADLPASPTANSTPLTNDMPPSAPQNSGAATVNPSRVTTRATNRERHPANEAGLFCRTKREVMATAQEKRDAAEEAMRMKAAVAEAKAARQAVNAKLTAAIEDARVVSSRAEEAYLAACANSGHRQDESESEVEMVPDEDVEMAEAAEPASELDRFDPQQFSDDESESDKASTEPNVRHIIQSLSSPAYKFIVSLLNPTSASPSRLFRKQRYFTLLACFLFLAYLACVSLLTSRMSPAQARLSLNRKYVLLFVLFSFLFNKYFLAHQKDRSAKAG